MGYTVHPTWGTPYTLHGVHRTPYMGYTVHPTWGTPYTLHGVHRTPYMGYTLHGGRVHIARAIAQSFSQQYTPSPHPTSPHLTPPHLASPHLTPPHLASPHLTSYLIPHLGWPARQPHKILASPSWWKRTPTRTPAHPHPHQQHTVHRQA